ncbi:hypothetical protein QAD02_013511 [Eretmocerus hayati]|uniref:Uncharacterized protein n=2 Tax=Eretmocerus hayati TaxID=131215 RepID=A0ACC2P2B5_9HYME|nr:hypothetical protein QAD02_008267 [Eretmocerus hayati]KAJ8677724.1 hypothetical protein QAD02_013511 [Eretmocerus hayati]
MDSSACEGGRKRKSIDSCSARHQRRLIEAERNKSLEQARFRFQSRNDHTPSSNAHMMSAVPTTSQGISVVESDSYPSVCVLSTVRTSEPTTDKSHDDQQLNSLLPENPDPETEFLIDSFDANDLIDDFDYAYRYSDGEDSGYSDDEDSPPDDNTKYEDEEKFLA